MFKVTLKEAFENWSLYKNVLFDPFDVWKYIVKILKKHAWLKEGSLQALEKSLEYNSKFLAEKMVENREVLNEILEKHYRFTSNSPLNGSLLPLKEILDHIASKGGAVDLDFIIDFQPLSGCELPEFDFKLQELTKYKTIYLAGGCFWGVEAYFKKIKGIVTTKVGYANGKTQITSYRQLKETQHAETVELKYDFSIISLEEILLHFIRIIDPTSLNKQGGDVGIQYRTGVYYINSKDQQIIERVFNYIKLKYSAFYVEVQKLDHFIQAEDYHQDYLGKNINGYCHVNLMVANEELEEFKKFKLHQNEVKGLDKEVLLNNATEKPFTSEYEQNYKKGIYVEKITGEPLFVSSTKFDAGCGWPSFSKPITTTAIKYVKDVSHNMERIEVRSAKGDHHLGHVFEDGPKQMGGLRYCINGAALDFIPFEEMDEKGYSQFKLFCE
ncbi:peptide-methionine (R)-S-oxide reductase MsrB [Mycoplasma phocimorsus]|uniref:peptide-methionine (R)-S-oxide reductase MsrB n=1 Tax=Mycoplasma phocimorsus TaxID=3045839 RepID=UPI0032205301